MRTKDIEQAGSDATSTPGKTSYTGNSVYARTVINSPPSESEIRGMVFTKDDIHAAHKKHLAAVPYDIFESALITTHGITIVDEVA